ncbi:MAG TPA: 3-dehydroquinate synthase [Casimicrobiaceae bacterium]|nr:3-dehydroquinate synthase [Casimicrobiaceae bacterium]
MTRTLSVALAERSYPIHVGSGLLHEAHRLIGSLVGHRVVVVSNAIVAAHYLAPLRASLSAGGIASDVILVPDGEAHKSWPTLQDVVTRLLELRADRGTTIVALGGGVVGDLAGFAAAIYQRGMGFVQVPTTLLAQVDSSVGGKTGINHPLGKNMIGAFHQPAAVLIDTDCLQTLPSRELAAGLAEVVKHGAIRDAAFFAWLEQSTAALMARDADALAHAIHESCRIKAAVVAADERETGERALLNFGHTFGHAIEAGTGYGTWLHGEAVGAGMVLAARLSERVLALPQADTTRLHALLQALAVPVNPPAMPLPRWLELMQRDKKSLAGRLRFILLEALGRARIVADVPDNEVAAILR